MHGKNRKVDRTRRGLAVTAIGALTLTGLGFVPPAAATLAGAPLPPDVNVTVFHNADFVATTGWGGGENLQLEVFRNGVLIGTAGGNVVDVEGSPGLEVNHGPETSPGPGDCWDGHTPDIRPGDHIDITHSGGTSTVIVDNITFSGPAFEAPNGDILVKGVAKRANGTNIPVAFLDSAEFRDTSAFRGVPDSVEVDPAVDGGFILRYLPPFTLDRNTAGLNLAERKASLLTSGGHAIGFGHVDPLPAESMLVDSIDDVPGPAIGCDGTLDPLVNSVAAIDRVNSISDDKLNAADLAGAGDVTITGESFDSEEVTIQVGTLPAKVAAVTGGAGGPQTWTVGIPKAELMTLADGTHSVSMMTTRTGEGTAISGVGKSLMKDVVAPAAPTATPAAGSFVGSTQVALSAGAGDVIRYNVGDGSQAAPTPSTGAVYSGPFALNQSATVKAIAIDGAGNVSPLMTRAFTRTVPPVVTPPSTGGSAVLPLAPGIAKAKSGKRGGVKTAKARWKAPSANGAVVDGYRVRALKIRPGKSVKKVKVVRIGASKTRVKMVLPRGAYRFQVRAISDAGKSPWSKRSNKVRSR